MLMWICIFILSTQSSMHQILSSVHAILGPPLPTCSLLLIRDGQIPDPATQTQPDFCKIWMLSDCTYHNELDNF